MGGVGVGGCASVSAEGVCAGAPAVDPFLVGFD